MSAQQSSFECQRHALNRLENEFHIYAHSENQDSNGVESCQENSYQHKYNSQVEVTEALQNPNSQYIQNPNPQVSESLQKEVNEHKCSSQCWTMGTEVIDWHLYNPLEIPLKLGWKRCVSKDSTVCEVFYFSPCGKKLSSMEEIQLFLEETRVTDLRISQFTLDQFCSLQTSEPNPNLKVFVQDITNGSERRPVSCINEINDELPNDLTYTAHRTHGDNVDLRHDLDAMVCCSCTDNCRNRSKCECWQLTTEEAQALHTSHSVGYVYGRLKRHQYSAVYECNYRCSCGPQCSNRLVQLGVSHRLQVFRSHREELKWGLRVLDDIPQGAFVCTYIGRIYTEQESDEKAQLHGDEYFAELDYIDVFQQQKNGYEAGIITPDSLSSTSLSTDCNTPLNHSTPSLYSNSSLSSSSLISLVNNSHDSEDVLLGSAASEVVRPNKRQRDEPFTFQLQQSLQSASYFEIPRNTSCPNEVKCCEESAQDSGADLAPIFKKSCLSFLGLHLPITHSVSPTEYPSVASPPPYSRECQVSFPHPHTKALSITTPPTSGTPPPPYTGDSSSLSHTTDHTPPPHTRDHSSPPHAKDHSPPPHTRDHSPPPHTRDSSSPHTRETSVTSPYSHTGSTIASSSKSISSLTPIKLPGKKIRQFYNEEFGYIMDAKIYGNIGRFINHSCSPNLFVQNIFIDTHDCRFPWVALFAKRRIKAFEELTWDYNYKVGSVPGRMIDCLCGEPECRGRLL